MKFCFHQLKRILNISFQSLLLFYIKEIKQKKFGKTLLKVQIKLFEFLFSNNAHKCQKQVHEIIGIVFKIVRNVKESS